MVTIPLAIIMLVFENKQNSKFDLQEKVYKILTQDEWEISKENGFIETSLDQKDGFVHLSTANQITGTLFYYFKYDETLMLIEYNSSELGEKLIEVCLVILKKAVKLTKTDMDDKLLAQVESAIKTR